MLNIVKKYDSYTVIEGNVPIILSAPHNTEHTRNGKIKQGEPNTRWDYNKGSKRKKYICNL